MKNSLNWFTRKKTEKSSRSFHYPNRVNHEMNQCVYSLCTAMKDRHKSSSKKKIAYFVTSKLRHFGKMWAHQLRRCANYGTPDLETPADNE